MSWVEVLCYAIAALIFVVIARPLWRFLDWLDDVTWKRWFR